MSLNSDGSDCCAVNEPHSVCYLGGQFVGDGLRRALSATENCGDMPRMLPTPAVEASSFIAMSFDNAMQAALITTAADFHFYHDKTKFRLNPGNTLPYIALKSLEERTVVHIVEMLRNLKIQSSDKTWPRKLSALTSHRDAVSHPYLFEWRRPEMRAFHAANRQHLDVRGALLWDLNLSINEQLVSEGHLPKNVEIRATVPAALMLSAILRISLDPSHAAPNEQGVFDMLSAFETQFLDFVIENSPPET